MGDELEVELPDAPARRAVAAVVGLQLSLAALEGDEGVLQDVQQGARPVHRPVPAEREDGVTFNLLDLQGRGELPHDLAQQLGDDRRAVLELGGRDERGEPRDVGQDQHPVFRMAVHTHETPAPPAREMPPRPG